MSFVSVPRVGPVAATGAALAVALVGACNALTGANDLEVGAGGTVLTTTSGGASATSTGAAGGHGGTDTGSGAAGAAGLGGAAPCDEVDCSGHGECVGIGGAAPYCDCEPGYHAEGLACAEDESCTGVDCGRCGQCEVLGGVATCQCLDGYTYDGTSCVLSPDPCDTMSCGVDFVCVPEAHCQPLGYCAPRCDCSNCGNCEPSNDGRWNDWQEYCGNLESSPATIECNVPCSGGDGCLPYPEPFCWPMEGCFSL